MPNRLAYPEILPERYHEPFLYKNKYDLADKLSALVTNIGQYTTVRQQLTDEMQSFLWPNAVTAFDCTLERLASLRTL